LREAQEVFFFDRDRQDNVILHCPDFAKNADKCSEKLTSFITHKFTEVQLKVYPLEGGMKNIQKKNTS